MEETIDYSWLQIDGSQLIPGVTDALHGFLGETYTLGGKPRAEGWEGTHSRATRMSKQAEAESVPQTLCEDG